SAVAAPLTKIDVGFLDDDANADVLGVGAQISVVFAGSGDGHFASPRKAAAARDVTSALVLHDTGGHHNGFMISRPAVVEVAKIDGGANKLAATLVVTNTGDDHYICNGMDPVPTTMAAAAGSLRAALLSAAAAGPDVIVFDIPTDAGGCNTTLSNPDFPGGFSDSTLTWNIFLFKPLVVPDDT